MLGRGFIGKGRCRAWLGTTGLYRQSLCRAWLGTTGRSLPAWRCIGHSARTANG